VTSGRPPARLKDVAALAGVSVKTVSNVVNDYAYVRAETRSRVQQVIADLGYLPNPAARRLRNGRSGVIAFAVPELDVPYFSELAHHIVHAAVAKGWTVLVDETGGVPARERIVASGIRAHLIDGAILSPLSLNVADVADRISATPMVLLGERLGSGPADHVAIDNRSAAQEATTHLIAAGRRRIAVIGSQRAPFGHTARLRLAGYRAALTAAGLRYDPALVVGSRLWRRSAGMDGARRLLELDQRPDAVFCLNDLLALGAMRTFAEFGVGVPDDVAVVGFDDIEESRYSTPTLTTMSPDKRAIAQCAVDRLAMRLEEGVRSPSEEIIVAATLKVRESSGGSRIPARLAPEPVSRQDRPSP
jgi:DNA-binding LacI/PurR family transcriptional regulator